MKRSAIAVLLVLAMALTNTFVATPVADAQTREVTGSVQLADGTPVVGATGLAMFSAVETDSDGNFTATFNDTDVFLEGITVSIGGSVPSPGDAQLSFTAIGSYDAASPIDVVLPEVDQITVEVIDAGDNDEFCEYNLAIIQECCVDFEIDCDDILVSVDTQSAMPGYQVFGNAVGWAVDNAITVPVFDETDIVLIRVQTSTVINQYLWDGSMPFIVDLAVPVDPIARYVDADGDGFGSSTLAGPNQLSSLLSTDCDDQNPAVRPSAIDIAFNGIDEDCDGQDSQEGLDILFDIVSGELCRSNRG